MTGTTMSGSGSATADTVGTMMTTTTTRGGGTTTTTTASTGSASGSPWPSRGERDGGRCTRKHVMTSESGGTCAEICCNQRQQAALDEEPLRSEKRVFSILFDAFCDFFGEKRVHGLAGERRGERDIHILWIGQGRAEEKLAAIEAIPKP